MIRIMIAEDLAPIRNRYIRILNGVEGMEVVCSTDTGEAAPGLVEQYRPDVVLMDIEMETRKAGLEATRKIMEAFPDTLILILTVYDQDELLFTAFQYGARDYLLKTATPETIIETIKSAYQGKPTLRPALEEKLRVEFRRIREYEKSLLYALNIVTTLTTTEIDILQDLQKGLSRRDICAKRFIEMSTLRTHVHHILKKFGAGSMEQLLATMEKLSLFDMLERYETKPGGNQDE